MAASQDEIEKKDETILELYEIVNVSLFFYF